MSFDFELAEKNAMEAVSPRVSVKGYFFQFSQNKWRKIQAAGLQEPYKQETALVEQVGKIGAFAFVPESNVQEYFNILTQNVDQDLDVVLSPAE